MPVRCSSLAAAGLDLAAFCAGAPGEAALAARIRSEIDLGSARPEWCWLARDDGTGTVLARQSWWAASADGPAIGVELVSSEDHAAAVALLDAARSALGVPEVRAIVSAPVEEGDDASAANPEIVAVLADAGFRLEVGRVTLEWADPAGQAPPASSASARGLVFRPVRQLDDALAVEVFAAVGDSSVDHGMVSDRERLGRTGEAQKRLRRALGYRGEPGWFSIAFARADGVGTETPIGYVVPGLAGDVAMIAEIGVVAEHRGHRYVDILLGWATELLLEHGATRIIADTDRANTAMRAAFARGGYREARRRDDYCWDA